MNERNDTSVHKFTFSCFLPSVIAFDFFTIKYEYLFVCSGVLLLLFRISRLRYKGAIVDFQPLFKVWPFARRKLKRPKPRRGKPKVKRAKPQAKRKRSPKRR